MLKPVIVLIIWTLIMLVWLYAKRIPAMQKAKIRPDDYKLSHEKRGNPLPPEAVAVADNYNHLLEAPTIFYALALTAQIGGYADNHLIIHAWIYVAIRIAHSLVQATQGKVIIRFSLFILSMIVLAIMAIQVAMKVFN
ncbi:MAG: MAPEG family protein [Caulobacterales bacterium]|nr:MAPEG family protein [Caulobacterales bacterium]MCA0372092.1 MAPEG family protein [Pseudomonadota bacterium]